MSRVVEVELVDAEPLGPEIAFYVSERLAERGAFAFVSRNKVLVDLSSADDTLTTSTVLRCVEECVEQLGLERYCSVSLIDNKIVVRAIDKDEVRRAAHSLGRSAPEGLYSCPHCGYITPYKELLREHEKIHYLFF